MVIVLRERNYKLWFDSIVAIVCSLGLYLLLKYQSEADSWAIIGAILAFFGAGLYVGVLLTIQICYKSATKTELIDSKFDIAFNEIAKRYFDH